MTVDQEVIDERSETVVVELDPTRTSRFPIQIGWWNTHLSLKRGNAKRADTANEEAWNTASDVIRQLERASVDVLALGEVSPRAVERLRAGTGYTTLTIPRDGGDHGIGLLFNAERASTTFAKVIHVPLRERDLHRCVELSVTVEGSFLPLTLILVHWPSRTVDGQAGDRLALGNELQRHITKIIGREGRDHAFVVIGGDFNDEPFDVSLTDGLWGTRDRALARESPSMLYNPFWRLLGERQHHRSRGDETGAGTVHWKGGKSTRWRTFDQFLVTSSMLGIGGWTLTEATTQIWDQPPLTSEGGLHPEFDHYPVVIGVEALRLERK